MTYRNRSYVRKKGVKVSLDEYHAAALEVILEEDGVQPATVLYMMYKRSLGMTGSRSDYLALKLRTLVNDFKKQNQEAGNYKLAAAYL